MNEVVLNEYEKNEIIDEMFSILIKEAEINFSKNLTVQEKRFLIDGLMNVRAVGDVDDYFLKLQDKLLSSENFEKTVDVNNLKLNKQIVVGECEALFLKVDFLVIFGYDIFSDYGSNENVLFSKSGLQIKEDFYNIFKQDGNIKNYKKPYIAKAYNLPSEFIAKCLLPEFINLNKSDYENLSTCLNNLLDFAKEKEFKLIAIDLSFLKNKKEIKDFIIKEIYTCLKKKKLKNKIIFANY